MGNYWTRERPQFSAERGRSWRSGIFFRALIQSESSIALLVSIGTNSLVLRCPAQSWRNGVQVFNNFSQRCCGTIAKRDG